MKLNRATFWATAAATVAVAGVGLVTVVGVPRSGDEDAAPAGAEQAEQAEVIDSNAATTSASNPGVEQYRGGSHGGGFHGGGFHGGGYHGGGYHGGGHGYAHGGWGHGGWGRGGWGRGGWERGWGRWGGARWGRWGGGRWVDGRWVAGPYYGWCDDSYNECVRDWW